MSKSNPTRHDVLIAAIKEVSELKAELATRGFPVPDGIENMLRQLAKRLSQGGLA